MIDKKALTKIKKNLETFDEKREYIIKTSRDILRFSKQAINAVHRNNNTEAIQLLKNAEKGIKKVLAEIKKNNKLSIVRAFNAAMEEYCEAKCFLHYTETGNILSPTKLPANDMDYLLGLCDLTGELGRKAVRCATNKEYKELTNIRNTVEEIHTFFLSLSLRNSELRKKYDSIKWNLKKIEDIIYDVNLRKK
jgi:predicted translin family RNA/ssDNA-binding protein